MVFIGGVDGNIKFFDFCIGDFFFCCFLCYSFVIIFLCFLLNDVSLFVIGLDDGMIKWYDWWMVGKYLGIVYGVYGSKVVMDLKWKLVDDLVGGGGVGWFVSVGVNKIV